MRVLIVGFGVVGQAFAKLLEERRATLYRQHGMTPVLVGVIDSKGAAQASGGLDVDKLLEAKKRHSTVAAMDKHGLENTDVPALIANSDAQLVIEATPTSVKNPAPAMERLKAAFRTGKHVVCINKGPLAVAFPALRELSLHNRCEFRYSGTVGGGTPVLSLAEECIRGDEVLSVRAILNGTTNFILWRMAREKEDFDASLKEAMRLGYAEADPSADVDGIDAATKVVILANGVLGRPCTIADVAVKGMRGILRSRIEEAQKANKVVKMIAEIGKELKVEPQEIDEDSPLNVPANLNCIALNLKTGGEISLIGRGAGGPETATAVLRDVIDIWHSIGSVR